MPVSFTVVQPNSLTPLLVAMVGAVVALFIHAWGAAGFAKPHRALAGGLLGLGWAGLVFGGSLSGLPGDVLPQVFGAAALAGVANVFRLGRSGWDDRLWHVGGVVASAIVVASAAQSSARVLDPVGESVVEVPEPLAYEWTEDEAWFGLTDAGHVLPFYEPEASDEVEDRLEQVAGDAYGATRIGSADPSSNCHGWVFTGGQTLIRSRDVPMILHDNGYRETDDPQMGDLVVSWDADGEALHTAVVACVFGDAVWSESKWGGGSVFLHEVDHHPYHGRHVFYRSERQGHRLIDARR